MKLVGFMVESSCERKKRKRVTSYCILSSLLDRNGREEKMGPFTEMENLEKSRFVGRVACFFIRALMPVPGSLAGG